MQTQVNRRHALRFVAGAAALSAMLRPGAALAHVTAMSGRAPVSVQMTLTNGFVLPPTVPAGRVPFEVSTPDVSGGFLHYLQGFQPRAGVAPEQVIEHFRRALSQDRLQGAEGIRALLRDAVLVGGAAVEAATTVSATLALNVGTYCFIDLNDFFVPGQAVTLQTLEVTGGVTGPTPPAPASGLPTPIVTMVKFGNAHRYAAPQTLPANASWRVLNATDQIHELALQRLLPGTVDADIQRFFDGEGPSPFAESALRGLAALSPGRSASLRVDRLPAGPYAMLCFAADAVTGLAHALGGMHRVVTLTP
jgi:hypothetical protein